MKITDVRLQSFQHPLPPEYGPGWGRQDGVTPTLDVTLVTVCTDEGIEGYSMGRAPGGAPGKLLAQEIGSVIKELVVGQDPLDREKIWQKIWWVYALNRISIFGLSCIDVALWDIAGKAFNVPVYKLLGGYRDCVPAYASSPAYPCAEVYVDEAVASKERGYKGYKIHGFGEPKKDVEICRAVREAVGPDMELMLDPGYVYDHRQALWVGRRIEELDFYWYEDPIGLYEVSAYAELARALDIDVQTSDLMPGSVYSSAELIARHAVDGVRADVYQKGGITGVMKMAHLCEAFGMKIGMHHGASSVMTWANLQVMGAFKNSDFIEVMMPEKVLSYGLQDYPVMDAEGMVHIPDRPGLGAEIDWDFINVNTTFRS